MLHSYCECLRKALQCGVHASFQLRWFLWLVMISLELHYMCYVLLPGEACVESMKLSNIYCVHLQSKLKAG